MFTKSSTIAGALLVLLSACATTGDAPLSDATSDTQAAAPALDAATFAKSGFVVEIDDGRVWVRKPEQKKGAECITWLSALPGNTTLRAPDADTALEYLAARDGFRVQIDDGRIWVLRGDQAPGAVRVTRINAGPRGRTLMAVDKETLDAYLAAG